MTAPATADAALAALHALGDKQKAAEMAAYHKTARPCLGVSNPQIDGIVKAIRAEADIGTRLAIARGLWDSGVFEARIAAAKLLVQARIRDREPEVWAEFLRWLPEFDGWALADHACAVAARRIVAVPERIETVEAWTRDPSMWVRRAALVATLPFAKFNHPDATQAAIRARVLVWAAGYADDREWFIQKAVAWWVRDLSKHDAEAARGFLEAHGGKLKAFARKEAAKYL